MGWMLILLFAVLPSNQVAREQVDLIELNHFYDEHGRLVFDQVIFYDWNETHYDARAWRMVKQPTQLPKRDWENGGYSATWHDGEQVRKVSSTSVRETWTQYDPELLEREKLPKERRRDLKVLRVPRPQLVLPPPSFNPADPIEP